MRYLLDSNVFIQAKNFHYGMDFCPAFWDWLVRENANGIVHSIDKVAEELQRGTDELAAWVKQRGSGFFLPLDHGVVRRLTDVSDWIYSQQYTQAAVRQFFNDTDYYLVAAALAHGVTVVTHEVPSAGTGRVKIPNVCTGLGVQCLNPFQMLKREKARFILD